MIKSNVWSFLCTYVKWGRNIICCKSWWQPSFCWEIQGWSYCYISRISWSSFLLERLYSTLYHNLNHKILNYKITLSLLSTSLLPLTISRSLRPKTSIHKWFSGESDASSRTYSTCNSLRAFRWNMSLQFKTGFIKHNLHSSHGKWSSAFSDSW